MNDSASQQRPSTGVKFSSSWAWHAFFIVSLSLGLIGTSFRPMGPGIRSISRTPVLQMGRQIGQMLFSYATDNTQDGNAYPEGASSTEVFQKLLDGNYCDDPTIFYVPMPGKIRPDHRQKKLKPENVSWDVTGGVDSSSTGPIPLVFLTGWKVDYVPGGTATALIKPFPRFGWEYQNPGFFRRMFGWFSVSRYDLSGMVVFYKGDKVSFENLTTISNGVDAIPNFVPPDFKSEGKAYRQLTPDGVLR